MGRPPIVDWRVTGCLRCPRCGETKPVESFYKDASKPSGHNSYCIDCARKHSKDYYTAVRPKVKSNPHYARKQGLKRKYSLSLEDYDALLQAQGGVCAACGHTETMVRRGRANPLSVDHSHEDGHIRGLLCNRCNRALGLLRDDWRTIQALLDYLRRDEERLVA